MTAGGEVEKILKLADIGQDDPTQIPSESEEDKKKAFRVNCMIFRDEQDILLKFPFPEELEEESGIFIWRGKPIVTRDLVDSVLEAEFEELPKSLGRTRFYSILRRKYWCVTNPVIQNFLNGDSEHQVHSRRYRSQMTRSTVSSRPGEVLYTDLTFLKRGGIEGLLTVIDAFSKKIACAPFKKKTAASISEKFEKLLEEFNVDVKVVKSDNGKEFAGEFDEMLKRKGIKHVRSQPHNPTAQGQVESANRVIKTFLTSAQPDKGRGFPDALKRSLKTYNNTVNERTGLTPEMLNNRAVPASILMEVKARLRKNAENSEPNKRFEPEVKAGDKVRLDNMELNPDLKRQKKAGQFKSSHAETFSRKIYTIKRYLQVKNAVVLEEIPGREFTRGSVLLVRAPVARQRLTL